MTDQKQLYNIAQGKADSTEGVCVDVDWASRSVWVNTNGLDRTIPWVGEPPWPGGRVRVVQAGVGNVVCFAVHGAPMGTVLTTAAGVATVEGDDGITYQYPHRGDAPANGDRVRLDHAGRSIPAGAYAAEPAGSDFIRPLPLPPPATGGSATFTPTWSGSWRYGAFAGSAVQSSYSRVAGWGYGTSVADTIPDTATVTKAELQLVSDWDELPSASADFGVHGKGDFPSVLTSADLSGSLAVPSGSRTIGVLGFADAFKTGSARGFGIRPNSSWWRQYSAAPNSGRLYLEWR